MRRFEAESERGKPEMYTWYIKYRAQQILRPVRRASDSLASVVEVAVQLVENQILSPC